ncbi:MAG: DUF4198 domain-containing protein [Thermoanaerobaculia bacterium]
MTTLRGLSHVLIVASVIGPAAARAHDFWIEPSTFAPEVVSTVRVRLRVGENFAGEAVRRDPAKIASFVAVRAASEPEEIVAPAGMEPAGFYRVTASGSLVLGYRSLRTPIRLDAGKFNEYLAFEGLDPVVAARNERGETQAPGREVFSRCAKSVLQAGGEGGPGFDHRFGWPLELVPLADPATLGSGDSLPVLVLRDGQPIEGVLVAARSAARPDRRLTSRSDSEGLSPSTR